MLPRMRAEDTLRPGASENDNRTKFFRDPTRNYAGDLAGPDGQVRSVLDACPDTALNNIADDNDDIAVNAADYVRESLPSYDELRELTKTDPGKAYYWSGRDANGVGVGPDGSRIAERLADEANATTLKMLLERRGMVPVPGWDAAFPDTIRFWDEAARAYAENAAGTVTAIVGCDVRPDNIWQRVEVPRLRNNPNVTRIIQIDPDSRVSTVIYERRATARPGMPAVVFRLADMAFSRRMSRLLASLSRSA
ncbi:hypothetical protein B1T45_28275 [Mycobacterium kansasii]|uniref:Uncharacterized protein n=4 Tax=Mycobacterium kansasii TaxID=1768 RepID=A0A653EK54_MYCKA|nr:hypothetical protein MKAN_00810 [Mycobacterium kansasii ATCC 12478]ARG59013.1 hypothetical protein B1T43_28175 [Mycobacterium kansasii]EUA16730.1 hypothetical protein I545_3605 [Mycobacterium kansasii 662]ARG64456.1 hypothetical protein B1T45_28275 [Mycobacterium kansasii]ARG72181.1 hypothetical protein B1T47_28120 [Mycobacterium kansasii]